MTDLTPEQIERWAGDEEAAISYSSLAEYALRCLEEHDHPPPLEQAILHAHALHIQQQATIERLTNLIEEHKRELGEMCDEAHRDPLGRCQGYNSIGKDCPGCPKNYMIDTQAGVK